MRFTCSGEIYSLYFDLLYLFFLINDKYDLNRLFSETRDLNHIDFHELNRIV